MGGGNARIATVRVADPPVGRAGAGGSHRLAVALLAASPRVFAVAPALCRADARGWDRRGGEEALARALREAGEGAGFRDVRVGIADVAVAADIAASLASPSSVVVPPGEARAFLAPLPLDVLPLPGELGEALGALGFRRIGDLARRERPEVEARFGPAGALAHRWACGEDDRVFPPLAARELPGASFELEGPVEGSEPLLFVLRHLLARVCREVRREGRCAEELLLELHLEGSGGEAAPVRRISIVPARPTARERLLHELCRAALEGDLEEGRFPAPVSALSLRVERTAPLAARQGELFATGWWDPLAADASLSRLRARLGEDGVVSPAPRPDHRPERRDRWRPARAGAPGDAAWAGASGDAARTGMPGDAARTGEGAPAFLSPVLHLLARPLPVRVRAAGGRPRVVWDDRGRHDVTAAEGPERLSGDWWREPYRREYYRASTGDGELLWLFREGGGGEGRWWLHGWWD